ncbi:hypothetical protein M758_3G232600 [Ceratodon purpureus]|nr:hypothetical protein M758_3G232600 [Ceratodon purpureus]
MGFAGAEKATSLADALQKAEQAAAKANQPPNLNEALEIAYAEANAPSVLEVWRNFEQKGSSDDPLFPSRRMAELVVEEFVDPQAVGHALVTACVGGQIRSVQRLRELQSEHLCGSMLVGLFNAFALLKAAEAGKSEVVEELLNTQMSASTALMGYMLATRWKDTKGTEAYPYVEQPSNVPSQDWVRKLVSAKSILPPAGPKFQSGGWDVSGLPGLHENMHELVRASYRTFLLWRVSIVAASRCNAEVFRILLERRTLDNAALSKSLEAMEMRSAGKRGGSGLDNEAKKIVAERAKMDTLMYQLVEEYSTKNYHDAMLYTLWGHIQRGGKDHPAGPGAGNPRCVAQAQNGLWEMTLEVPLLMMPVEYALEDEEPFRRYKQLTTLFNQRAKVNIQLIATVEAQPNFLQVTVGVKHVRFKAENSRWDDMCMGHFPTAVTLSVMPQSKEGTSVTMTNSSSNNTFKVGRGENISAGTGGGDGATRGIVAALRISAGVSVNSTVKSTPWRFEQLPLTDNRGGSFVWTLQAMKGLAFDRSNPHRMNETNSTWKWGRRVPGNPLDQLPFTSEGGVIFTGNEFADTMMWRFPKSMEDKKLRWSIQGQIHSTFTTSRYFETRVASFSGDIEERLKPLEDKKDKDKDKGDKSEKKDKDKDKDGEKSEKKEKDKNKDKDGEKSEKKEKDKNKDKDGEKEKSEKGEKSDKEDKEAVTKKALAKLDTTTRTEFEEWLEFKKYKDEQKKLAKSAGQTQKGSGEEIKPKKASKPEPSRFTTPPNDDATTISEDEPQLELEDQTEGTALNVKLDLDDGHAQNLANRPSLSRAQGYNGRWLGNPDMEPLSPSPQPADNWMDSGLLSPPRMPLGGITEDPDMDMPHRSASASSFMDREQRIKGLSVRSVRTSRSDSAGLR